MKLLIKFPTRSRPEKFQHTFQLYYKFLSGNNDYEFVITMNENDSLMNNEKMRKWFKKFNNVSLFYTNVKTKIQAVNANLENKNWKILLLASDDMIPKQKGYDDIIVTNMQKYFPDGDGVLHFNDGRWGKKLNTLSIMGKKYYDRFGYIYHPDYISLWCDNEFQEVSEKLGKSKYIDKVIIAHEWINYTGKDELHKKNEKWFKHDRRTFLSRKKRGFPKKSIK